MLESSLRNILVLIPLFVLLLSPIALAIVLTYFHNARNFGGSSARLLMRQHWSPLVLAALTYLGASALQDNAGKQVMPIIMLLVFGLFGGMLLIRVLRQRENPPAVLDLGTAQDTSTATIAVLSLGAFGLFILALYSSELREVALALGTFCLLLAGEGAISRRSKTLVTEDGLYIHQSLIEWERIKRFAWAEHRKDTAPLIVQIAGRPLLFDVEEIRIPVDKQEAVNQFLTSHVTAGASR